MRARSIALLLGPRGPRQCLRFFLKERTKTSSRPLSSAPAPSPSSSTRKPVWTLEDPNANQIARRDVEAAFLHWGRLEPALAEQPADLIVVIRRGHRRLVSETIPDPRQNDRIGGISSADDGPTLGARQEVRIRRPKVPRGALAPIRHQPAA